MRNIGMIVSIEAKTIFNKYGFCTSEVLFSGYTVLTYSFDTFDLVIIKCGPGEIAAATAAQFLITRYNVEMIVNFGVAGGLDSEMKLATTCIVESVVHYDFDTSIVDKSEIGRYQNYSTIYIPTTEKIVEKTSQLYPSLKKVICASGDKFISSLKDKVLLSQKFNASICEMEAAGIVLTCNRNKTQCLIIKTISDSVSGGVDEFRAELNSSARICLEITAKLIDEIT